MPDIEDRILAMAEDELHIRSGRGLDIFRLPVPGQFDEPEPEPPKRKKIGGNFSSAGWLKVRAERGVIFACSECGITVRRHPNQKYMKTCGMRDCLLQRQRRLASELV